MEYLCALLENSYKKLEKIRDGKTSIPNRLTPSMASLQMDDALFCYNISISARRLYHNVCNGGKSKSAFPS